MNTTLLIEIFSKFSGNVGCKSTVIFLNIFLLDSYSNEDVEFVWADDLMTGQKLLAPNVKALSQYAVTDVSLSRKVSEYAIGI